MTVDDAVSGRRARGRRRCDATPPYDLILERWSRERREARRPFRRDRGVVPASGWSTSEPPHASTASLRRLGSLIERDPSSAVVAPIWSSSTAAGRCNSSIACAAPRTRRMPRSASSGRNSTRRSQRRHRASPGTDSYTRASSTRASRPRPLGYRYPRSMVSRSSGSRRWTASSVRSEGPPSSPRRRRRRKNSSTPRRDFDRRHGAPRMQRRGGAP